MLKIIFSALVYPIKVTLLALIYVYKFCISSLLPKSCRFYPTCSTYMIISIKEWGVIKGLWLGIKRICRCRPGVKGGYDFVPDNLKGDLKWIY